MSYDPGTRVLNFPSRKSRPVPPLLTGLEDRSAWMRTPSIERQVLSAWMDIAGYDGEPAQASAWCRLQNDTVADDLRSHPWSSAFSTLPVVSGEDAAAELVRAVWELGFVGGAVQTQIKGLDLDEAGLDPLFESAEMLGAPHYSSTRFG